MSRYQIVTLPKLTAVACFGEVMMRRLAPRRSGYIASDCVKGSANPLLGCSDDCLYKVMKQLNQKAPLPSCTVAEIHNASLAFDSPTDKVAGLNWRRRFGFGSSSRNTSAETNHENDIFPFQRQLDSVRSRTWPFGNHVFRRL